MGRNWIFFVSTNPTLRHAATRQTRQPIICDRADKRVAALRQFQIHSWQMRDDIFTRLFHDIHLKCRGPLQTVALLRAIYNFSKGLCPQTRGRNRYFDPRNEEKERHESRRHGPNTPPQPGRPMPGPDETRSCETQRHHLANMIKRSTASDLGLDRASLLTRR